jgi:hypothetical protein
MKNKPINNDRCICAAANAVQQMHKETAGDRKTGSPAVFACTRPDRGHTEIRYSFFAFYTTGIMQIDLIYGIL